MCPEILPNTGRAQSGQEIVQLLVQHYQLLKQDMLAQMGSVKNHVRNSQILGTAFIAILSFLLANKDYSIGENNKHLWIVIMATITTVAYYLIYDILESLFALKALEAYLSFLEDRVNTITGSRTLMWQSNIAECLWPLSSSIKSIMPPTFWLGFYEAILMLGTTVILPIYVYSQIWIISKDEMLLNTALAGLVAYSIISAAVTVYVWDGVNRRFRNEVRHLINKKWIERVE
jgi:hypothetical protein